MFAPSDTSEVQGRVQVGACVLKDSAILHEIILTGVRSWNNSISACAASVSMHNMC